MSQGEGGGRPTAYRSAFCKIAKAIMKLGGTDREVAEALGVNERTVNRWKLRHPKFCQSLTLGKEPANKRAEVSLYRKVTGYSYDSEEIHLIDHVEERTDPDDPKAPPVIVRTKKVLRVATVTHVPPSDRAIEYFLNNRKRKKWKNRQALELSNPPGKPFETNQTYTPAMPQLLQDYYAKVAQSTVTAPADPAAARPMGPDRSEWEEPGSGEDFSPR